MVQLDREEARAGRVWSLARRTHGVVVRGWWSPERCAEAVGSIEASRDRWVADFDGEQFCLGRAWYTHLETDRAGVYFAAAAEADASVEAVLPGLQQQLRDTLEVVVGAPVTQRRGWCGAGVHVFPAGHVCARRGGDVHFDDEGLTRAQLRARSDAASLVLMLQPPEEGGALRIWDARFSGDAEPGAADTLTRSVDLHYGVGDLVVFDSYRLHQIQPFGGTRDRISVTVHGAALIDRWESWF